MTRYRKISSLIWNDAKFCSLSDDAQLLFLMLLTHPHMTSIGAMRTTREGLAAEKLWTKERLSEPFRDLSERGMIGFDEKAYCLVLPNFIKHNPPENPNVVKSWAKALELVPECSLKNKLIQRLTEHARTLPEPFWKAFETLSEPFRIQEPEPEPEIEREYVSAATEKTVPSSKNGRDPRSATREIQLFRKVTTKYPPRPNYDEVILVMRGKTVEEAAPFYAEWTSRGYNGNSLKWLEWLKVGAIPPGHSTRADGKHSEPEWKSRKVLREMQAEEKITKSYGKSE